METEKHIEMDAANGFRYMFVETFPDFISTYAWYNAKWNHIGRDFRSFEEALDWANSFGKEKEESRYVITEERRKIEEELLADAMADFYGHGHYCGD